MSKVINRHPAVYECDPGELLGGTAKYDILLHPGWHFSDLDNMPDTTVPGHPELRRCGMFDTVKEFFEAKPRQLIDDNGKPIGTTWDEIKSKPGYKEFEW